MWIVNVVDTTLKFVSLEIETESIRFSEFSVMADEGMLLKLSFRMQSAELVELRGRL